MEKSQLPEILHPILERSPSAKRRQQLIAAMQSGDKEGLSCAECTGVCCSFVANTMMITPLETHDLVAFLISESRWNDQLIGQMQECIIRFGLDRPTLSDGSRYFLRRSYTCPFYLEQKKGCSISRRHKPYGCLAFNPLQPSLCDGGACRSDIELLERHEDQFAAEEKLLNLQLCKELGFDWEKLPIPLAVIAYYTALATI